MIIDKFMGEYRWLSNFHLVEIFYDGIMYPSTEHAYVAAKTLNHDIRKTISKIEKCRDVKAFGRNIELRENWDNIKYNVMYDITLKKYANYYDLRKKLIDTQYILLVEGNTWGDTYWGVCNGVGQNNLGKIIMNVRELFL